MLILEEDIEEHLFLDGEFATRIWNYFRSASGILDPILNLKQSIKLWRDIEGNYRVKLVRQAIPNIILWILWKIGTLSCMEVFFQKLELFKA